ncbi:MAG: nitroreductase family protein [Bryobacterales bacterium]|nr:nitroreductase family protein [Bryobacterales bacterium]
MPKGASPDYPIHEVISSRWSPYCCSNRLIPREDLLRLFESARWAASSFNEQPWRSVVATRDRIEEVERVLSGLLEGNRTWARDAPWLPSDTFDRPSPGTTGPAGLPSTTSDWPR